MLYFKILFYCYRIISIFIFTGGVYQFFTGNLCKSTSTTNINTAILTWISVINKSCLRVLFQVWSVNFKCGCFIIIIVLEKKEKNDNIHIYKRSSETVRTLMLVVLEMNKQNINVNKTVSNFVTKEPTLIHGNTYGHTLSFRA